MKYEILAIDVDGTLLGADQRVAAGTLEALGRADRAGLRIVLATGRSYVETIPVWRELRLKEPPEPMILIGGALVSEPEAGRTLYQRPIPREQSGPYVEALVEAGYSALCILDAWRCGEDYLMVASDDAEDVRLGWFDKMDVKVRRVDSLDGDGEKDLPDVLRINALSEPPAAQKLAAAMKQRFDGRLNVHSILAPNYGVTIVEAFAAGADKWTALRYVAQAQRIAPARIAAVGDDVNDLSMIAGAGLGVAMPHAPQSVRDAAKLVASDGLGSFIRDLVSGCFDEL